MASTVLPINFVAEKACRILGWDITEKKIITCHIGNGGSITAIKDGKCVDTSMGLTPLEGLMMVPAVVILMPVPFLHHGERGSGCQRHLQPAEQEERCAGYLR